MFPRPGDPCRRWWIPGTRESQGLVHLENLELYVVRTLLNWDVQIAGQSDKVAEERAGWLDHSWNLTLSDTGIRPTTMSLAVAVRSAYVPKS